MFFRNELYGYPVTDKSITIGEIIETLWQFEPESICDVGFDEPHTSRGYYHHLGVEPTSFISIRRMLHCCSVGLVATFEGYKGGDWKYKLTTEVDLINYGSTHHRSFNKYHLNAITRKAPRNPDYDKSLLTELINMVIERKINCLCGCGIPLTKHINFNYDSNRLLMWELHYQKEKKSLLSILPRDIIKHINEYSYNDYENTWSDGHPDNPENSDP